LAKAKALRTYVEPLITKGKDATTHNQRTVFAYLKDKEAVKELFTVVGTKVASRPGGYTRILKVGNRMGDNAEMAFIELVDFNEYFQGFGADKKEAKKTRRGRSKSSAPAAKTTTPVAPAPVVEEVVESEVIEETSASVDNVTVEETPVAEVQAEETAPAEETSSETEASSEESSAEATSGEEENKPE
jgi:large subunit ribosomal protein L17